MNEWVNLFVNKQHRTQRRRQPQCWQDITKKRIKTSPRCQDIIISTRIL